MCLRQDCMYLSELLLCVHVGRGVITLPVTHSKQGLQKEIPDTPPGETPVHLRKKQIYATLPQGDLEDRWSYRSQVREQEQIQYYVGGAVRELQEMKARKNLAEEAAGKADSNGKAPS